MDLSCLTDSRRDAVRRHENLNGLDYVEIADDQFTLYVYFLGKLPPELNKNKPGLEQYLQIEGGDVITGIRILDVDPHVDPDPERDDYLVLTLDRAGDFSTYTLHIVNVEGIDPRYDRVSFSFKIDCPSDLDCGPSCDCPPQTLDEPRINYLAKDYASFRQLVLDRMALLVPDWTERHVPDLGITLVELLAYVGDYLSYYQDAVATEAYLGTARQRISIRRHARLVDYRLHEGCNARAWVQIQVSQDLSLPAGQTAFVTAYNDALSVRDGALTPEQVTKIQPGAYEWFEPVAADVSQPLKLYRAHNEIRFYGWGRRECCLAKGATGASLLDGWVLPAPPPSPPVSEVGKGTAAPSAKPVRALQLAPGDVLIFEEMIGARTGNSADADPKRRWAVRLTRVTAIEDALYPIPLGEGEAAQELPTPVVEIEWAPEDALPFPLCVSAIGAAPDCAYLADVSVARGNVVLVDHGRTQTPEPLGTVPVSLVDPCCECEGHPADVPRESGPYRPALSRSPLVFTEIPPTTPLPASQSLTQDPRAAVPALRLTDEADAIWVARQDLFASGGDDRDFVVEIDNDGVAHLRFGDGELGQKPDAGAAFAASYRTGGGVIGNVGAEAISGVVLEEAPNGVEINVRNPMPARGGTDPEPIEEARFFAPAAFRKQIERAIIAADYAQIAQRNPALQRAAARLVWTGSWYEADVAVDPWGGESAASDLLDAIAGDLRHYRRIGHDLRVSRAVYVPIKLRLEVCALPGYERGHVMAALLARFSNRVNADSSVGFFHPDELSFGEGVYLSRIVAAAQAVTGVECVTVSEFHRLFEPPNRELANGVLPLAAYEIAQLDNDPDHPERGQLQIAVSGGR